MTSANTKGRKMPSQLLKITNIYTPKMSIIISPERKKQAMPNALNVSERMSYGGIENLISDDETMKQLINFGKATFMISPMKNTSIFIENKVLNNQAGVIILNKRPNMTDKATFIYGLETSMKRIGCYLTNMEYHEKSLLNNRENITGILYYDTISNRLKLHQE